ncbi:unnamed protein product [Blepharisma stoltei]|uniref:Mic1 domain-containing protein n=1 Tax=Blepharisma stoltei TaxID=1481888 RepID=A0AAU9JLL7_9CILI|nr:unnamed protein product [Blepharisma stoltei]
MELGLVERWQHGQDVELFYNPSQRRLILKKFQYMYSKGVDDLVTYPYIDLQGYGLKLLSLCLSQDNKIVAFQRSNHELDVLNLETQDHTQIIGGKNRKILGYHWTGERSAFCDFVMVTNAGVEFYKLAEASLKFSNIRGYQINIGHYWFEPSDGVLVVAASPPKLGQIDTFFVYQDKGPKFFHGPRFFIDINPSVTDKWTSDQTNVKNIKDTENNTEQDPHHVELLKIYESVYLVHGNCVKGQLNLYKLTHEKVALDRETIKIKPGAYGICTIDNLLLIFNYTLQETYIFDIKSENYSAKPFCTLWNGMSLDPPTMTYKMKVIIEKPNIIVLPTLLFDGKQISTLQEFDNTSGKNGQVIDCPMPLDPSLIYVDHDACVDIKNGRCYKLQLFPDKLVKHHPDPIESILFLLRRIGCKKQAFELLKHYLRKKVDLKGVSYLFSTINRVYKIAALERKGSSQNDDLRRRASMSASLSKTNSPRKYSLFQNADGESEMRLETGMTVLFQSDLMSIVFHPLFLDGSISISYLSSVILEYHRTLVDQDLQVHLDLQILLAKVLVKGKNLNLLHQLVQYNVFNDTKEFASLLITLATPNNPNYYPPALQLAVDMLYRMRAFDVLTDAFIENQMIYEAMCMLARHPYPGFDVKKLLSRTEGLGDRRIKEVVEQFVNDANL